MSYPTANRFLAAAVLLLTAVVPRLAPAQTAPALPAPLTAAQIVQHMDRQNQLRAARLLHHSSIRHYHVEYGGLAHLAASMEVEATYDIHSGKTFRILSESGSHALSEKVLKRAVDSEREASRDSKATALIPANYAFTLLGEEPVEGRSAYILQVEPHAPSKFLYRGKIWVDAADFAVVKIEASPAKNPSFWITRTLIQETFVHTGGFWLPARNRSETHVRVGGKAVFTIDYGSYQFQPQAALAAHASAH
jgi:hypothetical protein